MDLQHVNDLEHLRSIATVQQAQIRHLIEALRQKCKELETFKGDGELQRTLVFLQELESKARPQAESTNPEPDGEHAQREKRTPQRGHGPTKQPALPHIVATHRLPEEQRGCSACGGTLEELEGQFETSETIDVVDVEYRVIQQRRQKYVCRCGGHVKTAPAPEPAVCGGRYSVTFAVKVVVDKYLHHLPLARQVRMMGLRGLEVRSQTLWDQVQEIGEKLEPSWEALLRRALSHGVIGVDQTGWPNLERKKHKKWQMWCIAAPDVIYHAIRDDKGTRTFVDLLGTYAGVVVCDDLKTHSAGARENRALRLAGCWAHVFRKFKDCRADHLQAQIALDLIHDLYEIDARAQTAEERGALRATESKAVIERLRVWLMAQPILRTTSIGAAIHYTLRCWERLTRFVHDPTIWLDNNPTERAIRGPVIGRRNHFGSKSRRGTHAAAILYSLIETAKLHGVDPGAYLLEASLRAQRSPGSVFMPWELQASA